MPTLQMTDVTKSYRTDLVETRALDRITLTVEDGELRWRAARALGRLRVQPEVVVPALVRALEDPHRPVEGGHAGVRLAVGDEALALELLGRRRARQRGERGRLEERVVRRAGR